MLRLDPWWRLWRQCSGVIKVFYGFLQLSYILGIFYNEYVLLS